MPEPRVYLTDPDNCAEHVYAYKEFHDRFAQHQNLVTAVSNLRSNSWYGSATYVKGQDYSSKLATVVLLRENEFLPVEVLGEPTQDFPASPVERILRELDAALKATATVTCRINLLTPLADRLPRSLQVSAAEQRTQLSAALRFWLAVYVPTWVRSAGFTTEATKIEHACTMQEDKLVDALWEVLEVVKKRLPRLTGLHRVPWGLLAEGEPFSRPLQGTLSETGFFYAKEVVKLCATFTDVRFQRPLAAALRVKAIAALKPLVARMETLAKEAEK